MIGGLVHPLAAANLTLLVLYPVSWTAPLAEAGLLPWFGGNEVSIWGGVVALWEADPLLSVLVALFAMAFPVAKTLALAGVHFGRLGARALPWVDVLGKVSMADVFLIAMYIVVAKGVGLGYVVPGWGLWFFTACVLGQIVVSQASKGRAWGS